MLYRELKNLAEFLQVDVVDLFDENGVEIDCEIDEEILDPLDVVDFHRRGGWVDVVLDTQAGKGD